MNAQRKPPLVFVDEYGQANLDVSLPDVGTHFILTAVLVEDDDVTSSRKVVDEVRKRHCQTGELRSKGLAKNHSRFKRVLEDLSQIPFGFYAVVVDKREIRVDSGLAYKDSFYKFLAGLLYRKLFGAYPDLHVTADEYGRAEFMDGFSRYLLKNHRPNLFDRPRVAFAESKNEPLVQLADVICGTLARTYDTTKTTETSAELLSIILPNRLVLIDEWPVRYRAASGTGALVHGDPNDDDLARYSISRAENFLETHETRREDDARAQVHVLKKLLYEVRFANPAAYVSTQALRRALEGIGADHGDQWLRSTVIAHLRDADVLVASSHSGYKIAMAVKDVVDSVTFAENIIQPMLNRVARARDAVLLVSGGRADVLADERFDNLRTAVDAIKAMRPKP